MMEEGGKGKIDKNLGIGEGRKGKGQESGQGNQMKVMDLYPKVTEESNLG